MLVPKRDLESTEERHIIAIAGPPGSGKSTLATDLQMLLSEVHGPVALLPMDGFHLPTAVLRELGKEHIKGHPSTFDASAFVTFLAQAHRGSIPLAAPSFDHAVGEPAANALPIPLHTRIILTEGNYLLSRDAPWSAVAGYCTASIFLDVSWPVCRMRLIRRRKEIGQTYKSILEWVDGSDHANYRYVMEHSDASQSIAVQEMDADTE